MGSAGLSTLGFRLPCSFVRWVSHPSGPWTSFTVPAFQWLGHRKKGVLVVDLWRSYLGQPLIGNVGYRLVSWAHGPLLWVFFQKLLGICKWWGWASIVRCSFSDPISSGGALSTFIHLSVGKAGPFTLENHIHIKALKMQGSPNN